MMHYNSSLCDRIQYMLENNDFSKKLDFANIFSLGYILADNIPSSIILDNEDWENVFSLYNKGSKNFFETVEQYINEPFKECDHPIIATINIIFINEDGFEDATEFDVESLAELYECWEMFADENNIGVENILFYQPNSFQFVDKHKDLIKVTVKVSDNQIEDVFENVYEALKYFSYKLQIPIEDVDVIKVEKM